MSETTQQETAKPKRSIGFRIFKWLMILGGGLVALIVIIAIVAISSGSKDTKQVENQQTVTPFNIGVTSQIVKKIDGKYRYFFDIRNNDSKAFEGKVVIKLYTEEGTEVPGEDFDTNQPIEPGVGKSVYFDRNTGTTIIHSVAGVKTFKFEIYQGDALVSQGEGEISPKLE